MCTINPSLQYLCECQFDDNLKFKALVNEEESDKMRLQPIGRDRQGLLYWLQLDPEQNIRLYTEEQDDLDGSSWRCIVRYLLLPVPLAVPLPVTCFIQQ